MSEQSLNECPVCEDVSRRLDGLPESRLDGPGGLAEATMRSLKAKEKEFSELELAFRALWDFCKNEMDWEGFRVEFHISDNPSESEKNVEKLTEFLNKLKGVRVVAECIGANT